MKPAGWNKVDPPDCPNNVAVGCKLVTGFVLATMPELEVSVVATNGLGGSEATAFPVRAAGSEMAIKFFGARSECSAKNHHQDQQ